MAKERKMDETATWAVAIICTVIIIISLLWEKLLHRLEKWFEAKHKKSMVEALAKIKAELMIMGLISLLLVFTQDYVEKICIPQRAADVMLPCRLKPTNQTKDAGKGRKLLWDLATNMETRRMLAGEEYGACGEGKSPLMYAYAIHQLHVFIFYLAIFHLIYTAVTVALGRAKIRGWKEWEKETTSLDYEFSNDPSRFRLAHQTSFVRQHSSIWNRITILFYIVSFFRQFFWSVRKVDYLSLRHGFISTHLSPGTRFDFQKYIKRSLEDDFITIVSISPVLWASAVVFLLLNVRGWHSLFWITLIPPVIMLAVGTKLQAIITLMALEIKERNVVVQGLPVVQLSDCHFWFGKPGLVLFLIHFALFLNAFQLIFFLWIWNTFGLKSCFHENFGLTIARICIGVFVQVLCSYVTLPLYALVSQMGSRMKKSVFDDQTASAIKKWQQAARKRRGGQSATNSPFRTPETSRRGSPSASPARPMQRFMTTGHSQAMTKQPPGYHSENDLSDNEHEAPLFSPPREDSRSAAPAEQRPEVAENRQNPQSDFSFAKAAAGRPPPV